jgi:hypothetical protein
VSKRLLLLPCLLVLSALALAACGSSGGEESKVEETIETSVTSTDPADCGKLETQQFMEQTTRESGKAAVKKCEEEAEKEEGAESVEVSNVEVEGPTATADAALTGSSLDGQVVEVELVKEGDQWKLNEAVRFTQLDQRKLAETFKRELEKSGEANAKFTGCFVEALEEADRVEIEGLVLRGSAKGIEEAVQNCS